MKPLKRFGQNYLTDNNIIKKIIAEISPQTGDFLIEIGPGRGALTQYLNESGADVVSVEIDNRVIEELEHKYKNVKFICADFLKLDISSLSDRRIRVIGNIPYNITSPILFKLFENYKSVNDSVLMMQDEVAKRIIAKPNTKEYGILSVLVNYYAEVNYCFKISPNVFFPKPKVNSALIHLHFKESLPFDDDKFFIKVVKATFGNRRKTLKNSLKNSIFQDCDFENISADLTKRAEDFRMNDFIELSSGLRNLMNENR